MNLHDELSAFDRLCRDVFNEGKPLEQMLDVSNHVANSLHDMKIGQIPTYLEMVQQRQHDYVASKVLRFAKENPTVDTCYCTVSSSGMSMYVDLQIGGVMMLPKNRIILFTGMVNLRAAREADEELETKRNERSITCPICNQVAWRVDIRDAVWRVLCQHCHHYFERNNPSPRT